MDANAYDFGRSFLQFSTDHSLHTPRLQIEASCVLDEGDEKATEFFLGAPCMSEHMYRPSGLVIEPTSVFWLIASDNDQFVMQKCHAASVADIREAHRVGERMSTRDGKGATMKRIEIATRHFSRVRRIETYEEIREAILSNCPLNGRTSFTDPDGKTLVRLNYPIKVCNIAHERSAWQIDTGPIIMSDPARPGDLSIARLNRAFILYNEWTSAEFALLSPTPVGSEGTTAHYSSLRRIENVVNELFCAE